MIVTSKQIESKQQRDAVLPLPVFFTGGVSAEWTDDDPLPKNENEYKYMN